MMGFGEFYTNFREGVISQGFDVFCWPGRIFVSRERYLALYECISLTRKHLLHSNNKEHTVVKVGEECHSSQSVFKERKVFHWHGWSRSLHPSWPSWQQQTMNGSVSEYVKKKHFYILSFSLISFYFYSIYYLPRVSAYFVLSYMATPQRFWQPKNAKSSPQQTILTDGPSQFEVLPLYLTLTK